MKTTYDLGDACWWQAVQQININVTLDVDPEKWATEFHLAGRNNIRKDVQRYFEVMRCDQPHFQLGLGVGEQS